MARGWLRLFVLSVRLGLRHLLRRGYLREAVIRVVVPMDPSRYLEFPETLRELDARPGQRVIDLASPKLVATYLARSGVEVVSVDELPSEIETWRALTDGTPGLTFQVAEAGRSLPFPDASFDHAYSVSVLEHIPGDGDAVALRKLGRLLRPGGRIVVTLPYAERYSEDWQDRAVYVDHGGEDGRQISSAAGTTPSTSTLSSPRSRRICRRRAAGSHGCRRWRSTTAMSGSSPRSFRSAGCSRSSSTRWTGRVAT